MTKLTNIKRQLIDIINEGNKFHDIGNVQEENIYQLNKYATELKVFLMEHIDNNMIKERLDKIPQITYEARSISVLEILASIFIGAGYIYFLINDYNKKKDAQSKILEMISIYSSIEFLLRNQD